MTYRLGQIRPSIHALDSLRQTGQDTPYRGVSVMSGNVRPDKTPQRSLISLRFFLSVRTNQRKSRTNGRVRPCPGDGAKKGIFVGAGASLIPRLAPPQSQNHIKISLCLAPIATSVSGVAMPTKKPGYDTGLGRNN